MSANRKYTQLTVRDLEYLQHVFNVGLRYSIKQTNEFAIGIAIAELLSKARANPTASICLAYAVARKTR